MLLLAVVVRIGAIAISPGYFPRHDDADYDRYACVVARTGFLPTAPAPVVGPSSCRPLHARGNQASAYRPPLWPLVLGGAYAIAPSSVARWDTGQALTALIGGAIALLTGLVALELWGAAAGLAAGVAAAGFAPLVLTGLSLLSEPLFVALALAAVYAVLRARRSPHALRWSVGAGVLVGLASLTRANGPIVALPLALGLWTGRPRHSLRALRAPVLMCACAALVIAPWTIRNAIVLHAFVPVSTSGPNTLLGTYNDTSRTSTDCRGCWLFLEPYPGWIPFFRSLRRLPEPERARRLQREAFALIRTHPLYVGEVVWHNSLRLLELAGAARTRAAARTIDVSPGAAVAARWELWLVCLLALAGLATGAGRRAPPWLFALTGLLWISTVVIQSETPRFRAPLDPFLLMFAGVAVAAGYSTLAARRSRWRRSS